MLEIPTGILAHLEAGGTLVTPSRQRAAALRLAHSAVMLRRDLTLWSSPDILPWGAWVERELEQARARGEPLPRRLSAAEQWRLWREVVLECARSLQMLAPEQLVDPVRRALGLLEDYGLQLSTAGSPEAALLLEVQAAYRKRCRELNALGSDSWVDCQPYLQPSARLALAGFLQLGGARRRWLEQHGARILDPDACDWPPIEAHVSSQTDSASEAQAAADWCAKHLARDPSARLLLVVPRLNQQRHHWLRSLAHRLDPLRILEGEAAAGMSGADRPPYALEGGRALAEHPLIGTALDLIAVAAGSAQVAKLGALLRSAYLPRWDASARLGLELWLRERGLDPPTLAGLGQQQQQIAAQAGPRAAALARELVAALQDASDPGAASWAERFASWLERCGWPGEQLTSEEQQVRQRFDALLGELAALDHPMHRLSLAGAVELLLERAQREHFEPASDDVAVTITSSLEDPIVRYDGIWVAGLSAEAWPGPAQIDALIPASLQRASLLPGSTPALQLAHARHLQQIWCQRSGDCVLSWSRTEEDLPAEASPLLQGLPEAAPSDRFDLCHWLSAALAPLEPWHESSGAPWPESRDLKGGARLLELQSLCPFRSYAQLRLNANELADAQRGVAARERGRMLHRALELFWRTVGGSDGLAADPETLLAHAARCATQAVEELAPHPHGPLVRWLLALERERTVALLQRLLEWERTREPFSTQALEFPARLRLAGHGLPLRLDRIDCLLDGRLLVLDYKSGKQQSFDAHGERPSQPQLAAYALALGAEVAGVAMLYFGGQKLAVRGIADRPGRLPQLRAVPASVDWQTLQSQWHERLSLLAREFITGQARVAPQARACERCHLQTLCRIDVLQLEAVRAEAEAHPESLSWDAIEDNNVGE